MENVLLIIIVLVALAAIVSLSRSFNTWRIRRAQMRDVDEALNPDPRETAWVNILVNARKQMPADQYEKFERAVMELVHNINIVNRSGLTSHAEKMAMLEELTKSGTSPEAMKVAEQVLSSHGP